MPKPIKFLAKDIGEQDPMELWWCKQFPEAFRAWDRWHYRAIGPCGLQDECVIIILRNKSGYMQRLEYNLRTQDKTTTVISSAGHTIKQHKT